MTQTYDNYHKAYYHKNRLKILDKTREYKKMASKRYYSENRELILQKRQLKRLQLKLRKS